MKHFFGPWDPSQREVFRKFADSYSLETLLKIVDNFSKLKVTVIGEPIVDTYVFCELMGIASKSPSLSARALNQEDYAGGTLAIANHLAALGCEVSLLITHGPEYYFKQLLLERMHPAIKIVPQEIDEIPTPRKTRYLIPLKNQRLFELMEIKDNPWEHADPKKFIDDMATKTAKSDVVILADFGHGLFEGPVLKAVQNIKPFLALNVQTNSGNMPFNPFTKHDHYDYLSIDERECRIAAHDRFTPIFDLARKTVADKVKRPTSITLGGQGSLYFNRELEEYTLPSFFSDIVDTTGSGDAYLSITSLLVKMDVDPLIIPFLGNCYGGLKARIIGNKEAVSKEDLKWLLEVMWNT